MAVRLTSFILQERRHLGHQAKNSLRVDASRSHMGAHSSVGDIIFIGRRNLPQIFQQSRRD